MNKPTISFIIQKPSPDLDNENYTGSKVYIRGAVHSLNDGGTSALGIAIPSHVMDFVMVSFENDRYRAEILDGDTLYKFYKQPSAEQWPRQEEGTALEKFQDEQRFGRLPYPFGENKQEQNDHVCRYSKAMDQEYPRKCVICGKPEQAGLDLMKRTYDKIDQIDREIYRSDAAADDSQKVFINCQLSDCGNPRECHRANECRKIAAGGNAEPKNKSGAGSGQSDLLDRIFE